MGAFVRLLIFKTYKKVLIGKAEFSVATIKDYKGVLSKFGIEIDDVDATTDLISGRDVELTIPVDQDYALDA